jgi:hypothetical protein
MAVGNGSQGITSPLTLAEFWNGNDWTLEKTLNAQ